MLYEVITANAGVLNITSQAGGSKKVNGQFQGIYGSNGFYKVLGQVNGSVDKLDYRISVSRTQGDGYRYHQAFWGNNASEKIVWRPSDKVSVRNNFV